MEDPGWRPDAVDGPAELSERLAAEAVAIAHGGRGMISGSIELDGEHEAVGPAGIGDGQLDGLGTAFAMVERQQAQIGGRLALDARRETEAEDQHVAVYADGLVHGVNDDAVLSANPRGSFVAPGLEGEEFLQRGLFEKTFLDL